MLCYAMLCYVMLCYAILISDINRHYLTNLDVLVDGQLYYEFPRATMMDLFDQAPFYRRKGIDRRETETETETVRKRER